MKGVILDIVPEAAIVDISHAVQAFDVLDGALAISQAYSYFPNGTVHVVVVDPGVGTERRPILASSDAYHFVAPDNGVLSMVYAREERMHVRHITAEHYFRQPVSATFHARDVFAPVAAYLAKQVDSHKFGDEIEDYVRFAAPKPKAVAENRIRGVVMKVDRFGNLITNVDAPTLAVLDPAGGGGLHVELGGGPAAPVVSYYGAVAPGAVGAVLGSSGHLELFVNRGSATVLLGAGPGTPLRVRRAADATGRARGAGPRTER